MKNKVTSICRECGEEFIKEAPNQRYCSPICKAMAEKQNQQDRYKRNQNDIKRLHGLYRKAIKEGRRASMLDLQEYVAEVGKDMLQSIESERYAGNIKELEMTARAALGLVQELKEQAEEARTSVAGLRFDTVFKVSRLRGAARALFWVSKDLEYRARSMRETIESYYTENEQEKEKKK